MAMIEGFDMVPWWFWAIFISAIVFNVLVFLHKRRYITLPCCGRQNSGSHFQQGQPAVAVELGPPNGTAQPYGVQQHQPPPTYTYYGQQPQQAVPVAPTYGVPAPMAPTAPPPAMVPTAQHPAVAYAASQQQPTAQHPAVSYAYADASPVLGQAPDLGPGGYGR